MNLTTLRLTCGILLFPLSLFSQTTKISNFPHAITYEIYVQSFADSDGDGRGDINGLTSKLDYLKELGVDAIWLMPVGPSRSYHKYDVRDYYDIDTAYGTLDDFKNFVEEAHKRNIKIIIDLVINHSGRDHTWFQQALKDSTSPYWNYYVWTHKDDPQTKAEGNVTAGETRRSNKWRRVEGKDYLFYAQFSPNMPDLNFDNPKLREEIFRIGRFWASEIKVDGFRLDAAKHIFPDERAVDNHRWWEYFRQEMLKVNKDFYLVGEVWAATEVVAPYLKGMPALFNFDMASNILKAINNRKGDSLAIRHKMIRDYYQKINPAFVDATFLSNHDQNRVMSVLDNDVAKAKLAISILMTLPGSPYLYYGEEIGMQGKKPDEFIREPFLWDVRPHDKVRPTWEKPRYTSDSSVTSLAQQRKDPQSLFNYYKQIIQLRNQSRALTFGELEPLDRNNKSISAFIRRAENESLIVLHNLSAEEITVEIPVVYQYRSVVFKNGIVNVKENKATLGAYSSVVLR